MRPNTRRRQRKRNRSTPTHSNPNKKSKQPTSSQSASESESWSDLEVDDSSDILDLSVKSKNIEATPVSKPPSSSIITMSSMSETGAAVASNDPSTHASSVVSTAPIMSRTVPGDPVFSQTFCTIASNNSGLPLYDSNSINTMTSHMHTHSADGSDSVSIGSQPHLFGYTSQFPQQHVPQMPMSMSMPVPFAPPMALSDADVMRIALQLKGMLRDEIQELVKIEVQQATQHLNAEIQQLNSSLTMTVQELQSKFDDLEQYSRRSCIRISGVSETDGENVKDIVMELATHIHADIAPSDIDRSHRVGRKNESNRDNGNTKKVRDIIVKFTNSSARLHFLKGRKVLREQKAKVFINEDLTSSRMELAFECRELKRNELSIITKTWIYNGSVFVQDKDGNKTKVVSKSDLDVFRPNVDENTRAKT